MEAEKQMNGRLKVCIYAICKNEEKFASRFMDHVADADLVVIGDTGSTDQSTEILRARGAMVVDACLPMFRFDHARNKVLRHIPEDIDVCLSLDIDELLQPGWRAALEAAWQADSTRGHYRFNWALEEDGTPAVQFIYERMHARHGYRWIYPTHEVLEYIGPGQEVHTFIPGLTLDHKPDWSKDRSFNLPLLTLAVKEHPESPRNLHYLGREYMYAEDWDRCIETLKHYLTMPQATWDEERAASARFIARAYQAKGERGESRRWFYRAMAEAPNVREAYVEMARLCYWEQDWVGVSCFAQQALDIRDKTLSYAHEVFAWDHTPYDLRALGAYHLGQYAQAVEVSKAAIAIKPGDARLRQNHALYQEALRARGGKAG